MNQFAFVAQGRLYVQTPTGVKEVRSQFGENIRRREMEIVQRNAWKTQGSGARFSGMANRTADTDPAEMPINITSVAPGGASGGFLYTLETPAICGLLRSENLGEDEHRLWHSNERRISDLCRHPSEPRLACSAQNENRTSSIAAMSADGAGLERFTEGDSMDSAPHWVPGSASRIVYQSAGIARDHEGMPCGRGPFSVHELDAVSGDLQTVAEAADRDLLAPQYDAAGSLYFIRRPYETGLHRPWWKIFVDVLLLPWRLLQAVFGFLNFFSMLFGGRPLISAAGGPDRKLDAGRMILWGNWVDARKAMRNAGNGDSPDLVPKSWELIRRNPAGDETVLARGVLSFDLAGEGSLLYTNGSAIFRRGAGGEVEKLARHSYIQQVIAC